jgi:hypothetical protein
LTKYDDVNWHAGTALEAGRPEETAGVHIGLYLGWLIRRDMHNPKFYSDEWLEGIKSRTVSGSEALAHVDGKLTSDEMTPEGDAFTAWYYDQYINDFDRVFGQGTVDDVPSCQHRIELQIDGRFREWIKAGRPEPAQKKNAHGPVAEVHMIQMPPREEWDEFSEESRAFMAAELAEAEKSGIKVIFGLPGGIPHEAPELERLIPSDLGLKVSSVTGSHWGAIPKKLLDGVGVSKKEVRVVIGIGSGTNGALTVGVYAFPGASAVDLDREAAILFAAPKSIAEKSVDRRIGDLIVHWTVTSEWTQAWWAADGLLIMCTAPDDDQLNTLIGKTAAI